MRSLRLALMCMILAGCAAENPGGAPDSTGTSTAQPAPGAATAPTAPGATTPPLRQRTVPTDSASSDTDPTPQPTGTSTGTSGGTSGGTSSPTSTPTPSPQATSTPTPKPTATPTPSSTKTPTPSSPTVSLSGSGPGRTQQFTLAPGYQAFHHIHTGSGAYRAWLLNDRNRKLFTIANTTGHYDHTGVIMIVGGTYSIEIEEAGSWSISISPDDGP